jgi:chorismate synthase
MMAAIDDAARAGETLGGIVLVAAVNVPCGLGSFAHGDRRLDGRIAAGLMSIPAVKGVDIGLGFAAAARHGAACQDPIMPGFRRPSARAGGIEGGVTYGGPLIVRAAVKPVPTRRQGLPSVDLATGEVRAAPAPRADVCAAPAAAVVAEAAVQWELAQTALERWGGDTIEAVARGAEGRGPRW